MSNPTPPFPNMPGAGAMTDTLEFVKNLWGSMGVPGMSIPSMAAPPMSVEDLDKKIADLKAVESWLNVNGAMLRATIQGLEVQRGTLATLKSMGATFAEAMKQATPDAAGKAAATPAMPDPAAWWNMLQDQFKQAVASAVPPAGAAGAGQAGTAGAAGKSETGSQDGAGESAPRRAKPAKN